MNELYRSFVVARIDYALNAARAAAPLQNAGVKGSVREILIADLFKPLVPSDIGVATGVIISAFDQKQSPQQDIIVFDMRVLPPILFERGHAIVPIESVIATIEVKSVLNAQELRSAHNNAKLLSELDMHSGVKDNNGNWVDSPVSSPLPIVFALESDLKGLPDAEIKRYADVKSDDPAILRGICVAGRGSFWPQARLLHDKKTRNILPVAGERTDDPWHTVQADNNHAELLPLIASIQRIAHTITAGRGRPPLDAYLIGP